MYDLRRNQHFALTQNPPRREHLDEFVTCYHADNCDERQATWSEETPDGRWRCHTYDDLAKRDKLDLNIL